MKKITFLSLVFAFAFLSCDELDKLTQFDLDFNESVTIESAAIVDLPINLFTPDIQTNSESSFESNNTTKDLIEEIYLKSMTLDLQSPSNGDFDFLKEISIAIAAEGMQDVEIASLSDIPNTGSQVLTLETSGTDIKEFIKKDAFRLKVSTTTDEAITQNHQIDINAVMFVDAKILGQ